MRKVSRFALRESRCFRGAKGDRTIDPFLTFMTAIAYTSPFVPVEWIAAHGLQPLWLRLNGAGDGPMMAVTRGICPYAGALINAVKGIQASALVLTTICDQMRYAAALVENAGRCPIFLLNVPSTWQTSGAKDLFTQELRRLGRFLEGQGGKTPSKAELAEAMRAYDRARESLLSVREEFSARQFAEELSRFRGPLAGVSCETQASGFVVPFSGGASLNDRLKPELRTKDDRLKPEVRATDDRLKAELRTSEISLAVLGGPLLVQDYEWFDVIERVGGRVVLDATEGGERTLPKTFDLKKMKADPLQELADSYFDAIPDAFRRPNTVLYEWLGRELAARQVRGIIFRRYVWCDLWHAELERLKSWSPVPVLELDAGADDVAARSRTQCRIEAFLEMLA